MASILGKLFKGVQALGTRAFRGGQKLGQRIVDVPKKAFDVIENIPIVGELAQAVPFYGTAKKGVDLAQRGVNVLGRTADLFSSNTPSEALARSMKLGREAVGARQRYKTTGGGTKFLQSELERK